MREPAGPLPNLEERVQLAYAQPVRFEFFEERVDLLHENAVGKVSVEPIPHPHRREIDGQVAVQQEPLAIIVEAVRRLQSLQQRGVVCFGDFVQAIDDGAYGAEGVQFKFRNITFRR